MRKNMLLLILSLFFSLNVFALSQNFGNDIIKTIQQQNNRNQNFSASLIYGGKDISHLMASAHPSSLVNHQDLV